MYYSSINRFSPKPILRSHNPQLIIQDLSIGIPLNIFSNIYTNLHYGFDITTTKSICLQFLLGYFLFNEPMNFEKLLSFILIWIAVFIYMKDLYEKN